MKLLLLALLALNFSSVDRAFLDSSKPEEYRECRRTLEQMLPQASDNKERAQVNWRIARVCLMLEEFSKGVTYADEALRQDPKCAQGYMWHCANLGRESQKQGLGAMVKQASVLEKDLETILNDLGQVNYSEAWQGLSEMYSQHPFKSNDSAVGFALRAAVTIPSGELRMTTYDYLATLLYQRNLSAARRDRLRAEHAKVYADKSKANIARYACYDAAPSSERPWKSEGMSDREEAVAILNYAAAQYRKTANPNPMDTEIYNQILTKLKTWK